MDERQIDRHQRSLDQIEHSLEVIKVENIEATKELREIKSILKQTAWIVGFIAFVILAVVSVRG